MDFKKAADKALESLNKNFGDIGFKSRVIKDGDFLEIYIDSVNLNGHDDNVYVSLGVTQGEMAFFDLTFDYLVKNPETLALINEFNKNNAYFKAYINDEGYLLLESVLPIYSENEFAAQATQFMLRGNRLTNDKDLIALTKLTTREKSN